jgi:hypothetical protein
MRKLLTTAPVRAGDCVGQQPEFGRTADVTRLYGIKRGSLYALHRAGKVKGCVLRVQGDRSGVRLWHLASVRACIVAAMTDQDRQPVRSAVKGASVLAGAPGAA